jgi:SAM-dependent methyltransferase
MPPRGLGPEYAGQFDDESVVAVYAARPPYPESLIEQVASRTGGSRARLLDLGCGTGELARRLAPLVAAITAVDRAPRMIAAAQAMAGGGAPNIRWIVGGVEDAAIDGTFDAALAAESFHWFDWAAACRRIAAVVPSRTLVLVERREEGTPWAEGLAALIARCSTNQEYEPYDLVHEIVARGLFAVRDRVVHGPVPFRQSIETCIDSLHSRNGLSRDRMGQAASREFDDAVRALVGPHAAGGTVDLRVSAHVTWGEVAAPSS